MTAFSLWSAIICALFLVFAQRAECGEIVVLPELMSYNVNTTSRTDYFVMQSERFYATNTNTLELLLAEFKRHYNGRVETFKHYEEFLELKLTELQNKLNTEEVLSDVHDHCVQKYRTKLPNVVTVKTTLTGCQTKAYNYYAGLASPMEGTIRNLKSHYVTTLPNAIKACRTRFKGLESNYTSCVEAAVKIATTFTFSSTATYNNQLATAYWSANTKIKEAFDCNTAVMANTLTVLAQMDTSIEKCISGLDFCPTCGEGSEMMGRCPYHMSWHVNEKDLTSAKIDNPFKGIDMHTPCLQINFISREKF